MTTNRESVLGRTEHKVARTQRRGCEGVRLGALELGVDEAKAVLQVHLGEGHRQRQLVLGRGVEGPMEGGAVASHHLQRA